MNGKLIVEIAETKRTSWSKIPVLPPAAVSEKPKPAFRGVEEVLAVARTKQIERLEAVGVPNAERFLANLLKGVGGL